MSIIFFNLSVSIICFLHETGGVGFSNFLLKKLRVSIIFFCEDKGVNNPFFKKLWVNNFFNAEGFNDFVLKKLRVSIILLG